MPISATSDYLSTLLFYLVVLILNTYQMVTYKFKLIDSQVPKIKGKNIITDSNVGGVKNKYNVYRVRRWLWDKYLGTKTFWRPYQTMWDKKEHRVPPPYWGKGPLLNMWLVLSNDYPDPSKVKVLVTEGDKMHHCVKLFIGKSPVEFLSQDLNRNLKSNKSFYQSKFERYERHKKR
jgi:hypothetical protein